MDEEQRVVEGQEFGVHERVGFTVVHPGCQHQDEGFKDLGHVVELCGDKHRRRIMDSNKLVLKCKKNNIEIIVVGSYVALISDVSAG